jgi:hypothetical protein
MQKMIPLLIIVYSVQDLLDEHLHGVWRHVLDEELLDHPVALGLIFSALVGEQRREVRAARRQDVTLNLQAKQIK